MTKKQIIDELKKLDKELDEIYALRADLKNRMLKLYGQEEVNKLFDKLHWTI